MTRQIPIVKERLRQLNRPASISEIGDGLEIPERTLRRWLGRLVETGFAQAYGEKKGRRYMMVGADPTPAVTTTNNKVWSAEKADEIRPGLGNTNLARYQANHTSYLSPAQRQRLHDATQNITFALATDEHGVIDAAFHSGRLDGNQCSHSETERLWYEGLDDHASLDRDQVRTLNQLEAHRSLFSTDLTQIHSADLLTGERLRGINYLLSEGLLESQNQGAYRRLIQGPAADYSDTDIVKPLRSLLNLAQQIDDPFEQSLFLLAYITRLAPFHTANAATARAFANLPLLKHRLTPLIFQSCDRDQYETAFSQLAGHNDVSGLTRLFVQAYEQDCQHFKTEQQSSSADTVRIRYRQQRRHLIRDITSKPGVIESFKQYISDWASHHIPETQRHAFIQETINDLARLAPFNLAAFGISDEQWQRWRQYCVEKGIRFKTQKLG